MIGLLACAAFVDSPLRDTDSAGGLADNDGAALRSSARATAANGVNAIWASKERLKTHESDERSRRSVNSFNVCAILFILIIIILNSFDRRLCSAQIGEAPGER